MKYLILLSLFLLLSCTRVFTENKLVWVCNCEEKKEVADWIKNTIKDSNNYSDEEMEDVIYQLEKTAVRIHCNQLTKKIHYKSNDIETWITNIELDSCETTYNF